MYDTIIFDGEGVVVDTETLWDNSQHEFLRRRGIVYDRDKVKHLLSGRSLIEGAEILKREYGLTGDAAELAKERLEIVRRAFEADTSFIPGFEEFYRQIRLRFKTAIATVMPKELLDVVVEKLQLRRLFGNHIYCPELECIPSKPEPDLFLYAAKELRSKPEKCMVIEDSPNGVEAAKRAGMFCIALLTTFRANKLRRADLIVNSFDEIRLDAVSMGLASSLPS